MQVQEGLNENHLYLEAIHKIQRKNHSNTKDLELE